MFYYACGWVGSPSSRAPHKELLLWPLHMRSLHLVPLPTPRPLPFVLLSSLGSLGPVEVPDLCTVPPSRSHPLWKAFHTARIDLSILDNAQGTRQGPCHQHYAVSDTQ
jgi:hypothetical protein